MNIVSINAASLGSQRVPMLMTKTRQNLKNIWSQKQNVNSVSSDQHDFLSHVLFVCGGGGGGTGWGGVSRNSDEARKNTECLCLPSHDFPYRSLPPNSVLYLPTRQTPERFPSSDHCKPCSVSLVISYSVSQGRLRASGNEAIASPAFVSSPSKGRFPKSVLSYTCGCTDTPWLSVPLIARPK